MAQLPIVYYPDAILEKKCEPVTQFDKKLKKLVKDMYETMIAADGVGLAAPQIGKDMQLAIVDIEDDHGLITLINPVIEEAKGSDTDIEGCLSFPGLYGHVTRPSFVKVKAQDVKGRFFTLKAEGFLARAIQHEIDHLHGVLFTSKVERYIPKEELEAEEMS
ncbi:MULTISPECIES: peptide deformylase [Bacillaceae]|uniref:Peptide deformylase n=1 Tax=Pseudobacillus wudalianchiensis TaxID=1743143 RepID=A0A1B9AJ61_9BACI|nr:MULTISPECIES: peptide deformylase [Bacillus]KMY53568.1 peptide deformylase [Bacillus sp. FJAT-27231]OCA83882.1 peptide deformylase [Bacillus wudalianchiensis]